MKNRRTICLLALTAAFVLFGAHRFFAPGSFAGARETRASAPERTPTPAPAAGFDQAAALAELREQIKGREQEPAEKVFKNVRLLKTVPAGRLLAIMEMGYARSLGVSCAHCHAPGRWESDDKPEKQIAREMAAMVNTINGSLLKNIKNLKSETPVVNCTTCHRGQIRPALNLPAAAKN